MKMMMMMMMMIIIIIILLLLLLLYTEVIADLTLGNMKSTSLISLSSHFLLLVTHSWVWGQLFQKCFLVACL